MEEPRKEENQNTGEENQNQSGLPVRSCMLMCLAGIYLLYTGYKLCKNVIDGVDGGAWYFMVAGIAFLVIGAGMLFYGAPPWPGPACATSATASPSRPRSRPAPSSTRSPARGGGSTS